MLLFSLLSLIGCTDKDAGADTGDDALILYDGFEVDRVVGTSAGEEETDSCAGWYPTTPQHVMTIETSLSRTWIEADTTEVVLMITYGGSTFCSDNNDGLPRVDRGTWSAGDYEVYVGVPEEGGAASDYVLTAVEA